MNEREATERALKHYKAMAAADAEYPVNDDLAKHRREAIAALEKQMASEKSFSEAKKNGIGR